MRITRRLSTFQFSGKQRGERKGAKDAKKVIQGKAENVIFLIPAMPKFAR